MVRGTRVDPPEFYFYLLSRIVAESYLFAKVFRPLPASLPLQVLQPSGAVGPAVIKYFVSYQCTAKAAAAAILFPKASTSSSFYSATFACLPAAANQP